MLQRGSDVFIVSASLVGMGVIRHWRVWIMYGFSMSCKLLQACCVALFLLQTVSESRVAG